MKKIIIPILISLLAFNVNAQVSATDNFQTKTKINSNCLISVDDISFGVVDQEAPGFIGSTNHIQKIVPVNISVLCNNKLNFTLKGTATETRKNNIYGNNSVSKFLDNSEGYSDALAYYIYTSSQMTALSGFNATEERSIKSIGTGILQNFTVYAGLFTSKQYPGYHVRPGFYSGNFNISITY